MPIILLAEEITFEFWLNFGLMVKKGLFFVVFFFFLKKKLIDCAFSKLINK